MLSYILEVSICWGAFYLLYWLLLSRETFFHFNRWYLLGTLLASLVIPAVEWEMWTAQTEMATVYLQPITIGVQTLEVTVTATALTPKIGVLDVLTWIYWAGMVFFMVRFLVGLSQIYRLYHRSEKRNQHGYQLVLSEKAHAPFSFFNRLFLSKKIELDPDDRAQILQHELTHIRDGHSFDMLLLEILNAIFWCSPFIYLYRRSLRNVHEYIADAAVLRTTQRKQYGHLLIRQSQSGPAIAIANHFHSQLKKRILMMMRNQSKRRAMLKYLLVMPLTLFVLLVFSNAEAKASLQQQAEELQQTIQEELVPSKEITNSKYYIEKSLSAQLDTLPDYGPFTIEIYKPNGDTTIIYNVEIEGSKVDFEKYAKIQPEDIEQVNVEKGLIKIWMRGKLPAIDPKAPIPFQDENVLHILEDKMLSVEETRELIQKVRQFRAIKSETMTIMNPEAAMKKYGEKGKDGAVLVYGLKFEEIDSVPGTTSAATLEATKPDFEIYYPDGRVEKFSGEDSEVLQKIDPGQIASIDVFKTPKALIKIRLKGQMVDEIALFPGCDGEQNDFKRKECSDNYLMLYVAKNIKYPKVAREQGIEGQVVVKFQISKSGKVHSPKIIKSVGSGCDEEVLRIVNEMPSWTPAKKNGKSVASEFVIPVKFEIHPAEVQNNIGRDTFISVDGKTDEKRTKVTRDPEVVVVGESIKKPEVFTTVEEMPEFPGGVNKLMEFLAKNIKYPKVAREAGLEGRVIIQFIVGKDSTIRDAKVVKGISSDLDAEALRVIKLMPKWTPGKQKGKAVDTQFVIPIQFSLQGASKENLPNRDLPANTLQLQNFKASPNPTNGILNLSFTGEKQPTLIKVFDLQGKELYGLKVADFSGSFYQQIDLSKAPKGTLIISVIQGEKVYSEKIVVQ